jgi:hypothetical protein
MLADLASPSSKTADDREARVRALLDTLRQQAEEPLRQMAEHLADLPEGKAFGQIEYDLGDLARAIAAAAHQAGLQAGKKGAT